MIECDNLIYVNFGNKSKLTSIDHQAFLACSKLESIIIPKRVTSIGAWAFLKCENLKIISIPDSVTSIGGSAFSNCTSLKDIFYKGTKRQWKSIDKGEGWDDGMPDYTIHCADGDLKKGE